MTSLGPGRSPRHWRATETETTLVDMYTTSGITAGEQGDPARAALWFANAARRASADPDRRLASAVRARAWGRLAITPRTAIVADGTWPAGLVFHPGGRHLITRSVVAGKTRDASNMLWDLGTERSLVFPGGQAAVPAAAWSPDGRSLATGGSDGDVIISSFPVGEEAARIAFPGRIRLLTYSADGLYLAIAGGQSARVCDVQSRRFISPELRHPQAVTALAFHPAGAFLATGCLDDRARLFAVPGDDANPLWPPVPHLQQDGAKWYPVFVSPPRFVDVGRDLLTYGARIAHVVRSRDRGEAPEAGLHGKLRQGRDYRTEPRRAVSGRDRVSVATNRII